MSLKKQKSLTSFIAEEDGKTIKKSLLLASLWLVSGLVLWANTVQAVNDHSSSTSWSGHSNCHTNHNSHSSY